MRCRARRSVCSLPVRQATALPTIPLPWLRYFARALFCRPLKDCAISSVVERLLHTQEVAGSNPASRMFSRLCRNLKREFGVQRSPRRQVAGSNPASRMFSRLSRNLKRELGVERSPRRQVAGSNPASRMFSRLCRNLKRELGIERSPRRQVAGSNPASRMFSRLSRNLKREFGVERSPRRQFDGEAREAGLLSLAITVAPAFEISR